MTRREQQARAFAAYFRDALVTRACRRAVRRLGRSLTADEHRVIRIAVRSFLPPRRSARYAVTGAGRKALAKANSLELVS